MAGWAGSLVDAPQIAFRQLLTQPFAQTHTQTHCTHTQTHPQALPQEYSLAPDAPQIAFRQLRHEWAKMGYTVPPESPDAPRRGLLDGHNK